MSSLPSITGKQAVKAFGKLGFRVDRVTGSHHIMRKDGHPYLLSVPVHSAHPLKPGTLRSLIRAAGITPEQFARLVD